MPANLTPEYREAEKRYRQAKAIPERIEALEDMLSVMPKHKGTDRLRAELRTRLSRLTQEAERRHLPGARGHPYYIRKEGAAGQVVLVGLPNTGKSQLLASLTSASPKIAPYPFTTRSPLPGMMEFENIAIQLVDTPPLNDRETHPWLHSLLKRADLLLPMVDLSQEPVGQVEQLLAELSGLRFDPSAAMGKIILMGNKADLPGSGENYRRLEAQYGDTFPTLAVSSSRGQGLEELRRRIFQALNIIRVYTKAPGRPADFTDPVILKRGNTVEEVATSIHKDIVHRLKYAQIWGSGKFSGQRVPRHYQPEDGDVIELHD